MDKINWKEPEASESPKRPFTVRVEEDVAKPFIKAVKGQGLYVRETMVKLMREFAKKYGGYDEEKK